MAAKKGSKETGLAKWDQELADAAKNQAEKEKLTGFKSINVKGGQLMVEGNPVKDNEMQVVILAGLHENQYYKEKYDPGKVQVPDCYAIEPEGSKDPEKDLKPHEKADDPQHDDCATCPHNAWGSADTGKGKACANVRRLAVMTVDGLENAETIGEAEVRSLKLSVMNVKPWASYIKNTLPELNRPVWGVETKIKIHPDAKSQYRVAFTMMKLIEFDKDTYPALKKKVADAEKQLRQPYPDKVEEAPPPPRGKAAKGGKQKGKF